MNAASRIGARTGSAASSTFAGAVSEEQFRAAFDAVPPVRFESQQDFFLEIKKQAAVLENVNNDWTKRIKALQVLRGILVEEVEDGIYGFLAEQVKPLLGTALELSVKDLRSQVCREACITIAYFCEKLGTRFWRVAESVLPITMNLSQNSAKVMATSGQICNIYIIKNVQHPAVLSIVVNNITSDAKAIRRMAILLVKTMITDWNKSILDKHISELLRCIKLRLSDADPEVRATARQTFDCLQKDYSKEAKELLNELESSIKRILVGSSAASSTHSVNSERDNLPNPNRGLYNPQNAFLNKRSASDLNHAVRRLNLALPKVVHRPNVVRSGKPPQATSTTRPTHHNHPSAAFATPVSRKIVQPPVVGLNKLQKSTSTTDAKSAASQSQPGSRSSSPGRARQPPPRPQIAIQQAPTAAAGKKLQNGRDRQETGNTPMKPSAHGQSNYKDFVRALKNVDTQTRNIRPNVIRNDGIPPKAQSPPTVPSSHFSSRPSASPSTDFYGLSQKQEAALHRISSEEHNASGGSSGEFHRKSSANNSFVDVRSSPMRDGGAGNFHNGHNKWSFLNPEQLANNIEQQAEFIQEICDTIGPSAGASNEKEIEEALQALTRMIRDGGITLWNDYFNTIFFAVQQIISRDMERQYISIKSLALKTLKELCLVQPNRLVTKTELLIMLILNAHECDDATLAKAAEECGAAVAIYLPTNTCINLLLTVIDDKNSKYHQLSGAIKMLGNLLSKLPPEEVEELLPAVVPRMTQCYDNAQSMVRRSAIICLVNISHSIGLDVLQPHLSAPTLKLVGVYRDRMLKKSGCDVSG